MKRAVRHRRSTSGRRTRATLSAYRAQWPVVAIEKVPKFQLKVPALQEKTETQQVPEYVRLDVQRPGLLGKLAPHPVLHRSKAKWLDR